MLHNQKRVRKATNPSDLSSATLPFTRLPTGSTSTFCAGLAVNGGNQLSTTLRTVRIRLGNLMSLESGRPLMATSKEARPTKMTRMRTTQKAMRIAKERETISRGGGGAGRKRNACGAIFARTTRLSLFAFFVLAVFVLANTNRCVSLGAAGASPLSMSCFSLHFHSLRSQNFFYVIAVMTNIIHSALTHL